MTENLPAVPALLSMFLSIPRLVSMLLPGGLMLLLPCITQATTGGAAISRDDTILLRPFDFDTHGPWLKEGDYLKSSNIPGVALGGVTIAKAGDYHIWTRSLDFPGNRPGSRRYLVKIDGIALARESGAHLQEGWRWEKVDTRNLAAGIHSVEIEDTTRFYARAGGILFTRTETDPNPVTFRDLDKFRQAPVQAVRAPRISGNDGRGSGIPAASASSLAAELRNDSIILRFLSASARTPGGTGSLQYEIGFPGRSGVALKEAFPPLLLLTKKKAGIQTSGYFPAWEGSATEDWLIGERRVSIAADPTNPFLAVDTIVRLFPVSARLRSPESVEISWRAASGGLSARTLLSLPKTGHAFRLETSLTVPAEADYSLAWSPSGETGVVRERIRASQLPPLFQFRRLPETPQMLTSSVTPVPMALLELGVAGQEKSSLTVGVLADPDGLPEQWPSRNNATCGFSLMGDAREFRPLVFAPVPGGPGSRIAAGGTLRVAWWAVAAPSSWDAVMRETNTSLYRVSDYREPWAASLTGQALEIIDLIKKGPAFLWLDDLKGPSNIEDAATVTQASPLMLLSAASLTRDLDFFEKRSLPTLEYMLSRPGSHFALKPNSYVGAGSARLAFDQRSYGAGFWQGAHGFFGRLNPWLARQATRQDGSPRRTAPPSIIPAWTDKLSLYRLAPDPVLLAEIQADADTWLRDSFYPKDTRFVGLVPFYNISFYPWWWDLLDLYEVTGEKRYVDHAREAAAQTVAGLWVHPLLPPGGATRTLYPGNKVKSWQHDVWWQGDHRGRLGWTEEMLRSESRVFPMPSRTVPAWLTSPVGLGLEQPMTYYNAAAPNLAHIQLSVWAANLLRLSGATGDNWWRTYARNTLIGRGSTYPGYYLSDFIDLMHDPEYPGKGPDLTSFYWHHAPVHLAMLVDYLVTDAEVRTGGAVRFPFARQQGYAWFSSRIYGSEPGTVLGDTGCRLWIDRDKFGVDTPKVDHLGARSRDKFHLILLNQARGRVRTTVHVDPASIGIVAREGSVRPGILRSDTNGKSGTIPFDSGNRAIVELPKDGWAILTFDARPDDFRSPDASPLPPEAAPQKHAIGEPWGNLHAFRIRTPFGSDSLYMGFTGQIPEGSAVDLLMAGSSAPAATVTHAPWELGLYHFPQDKDAGFRLRLSTPDGNQLITTPFTFPAK
ncbi:MAG: hypothetical protein LBK99_02160 [Opitutaceae bacterium]|jgi:hypothetical protein|nr:hypothetical protein [Opitutaceae bacterium]